MSEFERTMSFLGSSLSAVLMSLGLVAVFSLLAGLLVAGWVKAGRIVIKLIKDAWHEEVKIFRVEKTTNGKMKAVK